MFPTTTYILSFKQVFNHDCKHDRFTSIFLRVKKPIWRLVLVNQHLTKIIKMQLPYGLYYYDYD